MGAVDIGVRHNDDFVIPQPGHVEVSDPNPRANGSNHVPNFVVAQHFVVPGLFDVQNLTLKRQNRLELPVAPALGGTACRFALN